MAEQGQNLPPEWGRASKQASWGVPSRQRTAPRQVQSQSSRPSVHPQRLTLGTAVPAALLPPSVQSAELVFPGQGAAPKLGSWGTAKGPHQEAILIKAEVDSGPKRGPVKALRQD